MPELSHRARPRLYGTPRNSGESNVWGGPADAYFTAIGVCHRNCTELQGFMLTRILHHDKLWHRMQVAETKGTLEALADDEGSAIRSVNHTCASY